MVKEIEGVRYEEGEFVGVWGLHGWELGILNEYDTKKIKGSASSLERKKLRYH